MTVAASLRPMGRNTAQLAGRSTNMARREWLSAGRPLSLGRRIDSSEVRIVPPVRSKSSPLTDIQISCQTGKISSFQRPTGGEVADWSRHASLRLSRPPWRNRMERKRPAYRDARIFLSRKRANAKPEGSTSVLRDSSLIGFSPVRFSVRLAPARWLGSATPPRSTPTCSNGTTATTKGARAAKSSASARLAPVPRRMPERRAASRGRRPR